MSRTTDEEMHGAVAKAIVSLARERGTTRSLCPSEVARRFDPDDWRQWMPAIREAAGRLAARGVIEVLQRGEPVEPTAARGPIRIRLSDQSRTAADSAT